MTSPPISLAAFAQTELAISNHNLVKAMKDVVSCTVVLHLYIDAFTVLSVSSENVRVVNPNTRGKTEISINILPGVPY